MGTGDDLARFYTTNSGALPDGVSRDLPVRQCRAHLSRARNADLERFSARMRKHERPCRPELPSGVHI
ncbi:unnamed protein product [Leptidea sinapis]|uniref:Uncharacterized protein n=1 Tax=Leptidea sinapis TaxID=189913 RepID=A0A5E4PRC3_9NEOP|nr:unnamed protein product [Leptidea sinapis]